MLINIYAHKNSPKLLADIKGLQYNNSLLNLLNSHIRYYFDKDEVALYINTWLGASPYIDEKGCTLNSLHYLFDSIIRDIFCTNLYPDILDFIPQIYFPDFQIENIIRFLELNKDKKLIFISNNHVLSKQSNNFDFNPIISYLSDKYPNLLFLLTNKYEPILKKHNIFYTKDIIMIEENDLNENAYLSTFCDIIVGRASGPYTFSYIKENLNNKNKKFICFCDDRNMALWIQPYEIYVKAEIIWDNCYNFYDVLETIDFELKKL